MCKFKSGIILKNKVVLAPEGNESHTNLLEELDIEDSERNASKVFVRVELTPPDGNKGADINNWKYRVDQDIRPEWYDENEERYEKMFRDAVQEYLKDKITVICGHVWTKVKVENFTYYFMDGILKRMIFGRTNNYKESSVREYLNNSKLANELKNTFGNKLIPISLDLTSMDGYKDYGIVDGDILSIPNIQLLMKFGDSIPLIDSPYWLATPNQTPSRNDGRCVRCVYGGGSVGCDDCGWNDGGVRPFFILKS